MKRREFIWSLSLGLAGACTGWRLSWPAPAGAAHQPLSVAFLADAHLLNGDPHRAEAIALARAVAEIRALRPLPNLVLFAGDLAHNGNLEALALGEEILSDLPVPLLAVRGEGDGFPQKGRPGWRIFDQGCFFHSLEGINLLGLDTAWQDTPEGPAFALGEPQQRWLAAVLARLQPADPLIILSHAPLIPLFRPWGQWTRDSGPLMEQLSRFDNIFVFHGHVHHCGLSGDGNPNKSERTPKTSFSLALPATSWPLPSPLTGTPRKLRPGLGPNGCGWGFLNLGGPYPQFHQMLWQA